MKLGIPFNYFYQMFITKCNEEIIKSIDESNYSFIDITTRNSKMLSIYNKVIYQICIDYVSISNADIDVFPTNNFEFISLILEKIYDNPYKESFLTSLQFIYQDYLAVLEKGSPLLFSAEDENSPSHLEITIDNNYQILQFDSINMDLLEQTKAMTKYVEMESQNKVGPHPKILFHVRKDIR